MRVPFEKGDTKAWCLMRDGCYLWTTIADNVVYEAVNDEDGETPVFTLDSLQAMNDGDVVKGDVWTVECHMVDEAWIETLPEHDGW